MNNYFPKRQLPQNHESVIAQVKRVIEKSSKPLSIFNIASFLGIPYKRVSHAVGRLVQLGGVTSIKVKDRMRYTIPSRVEKPENGIKGPYAIAGRITKGRGSRWYSGLV